MPQTVAKVHNRNRLNCILCCGRSEATVVERARKANMCNLNAFKANVVVRGFKDAAVPRESKAKPYIGFEPRVTHDNTRTATDRLFPTGC